MMLNKRKDPPRGHLDKLHVSYKLHVKELLSDECWVVCTFLNWKKIVCFIYGIIIKPLEEHNSWWFWPTYSRLTLQNWFNYRVIKTG